MPEARDAADEHARPKIGELAQIVAPGLEQTSGAIGLHLIRAM